jgi:hypothetical protein
MSMAYHQVVRSSVAMNIHHVDTASRQDVARFVQFPYHLYRDCPQWVPPLVSAGFRTMDNRHPFYEHSVAAFFLAERGGAVVGRIAALENRNYNRYRHANTAFFGYFDAEDDGEASDALFAAASDWAWKRGLDAIAGPHGLLGSEGGSLLLEGFDLRPAMGAPYNFPYYHRLISQAGFLKDTDFLSAQLDIDYVLPERVRNLANKARARSGFQVKSFRSKRELRSWIPRFMAAHGRAFANNHTYYPPTPAEVDALVDTILWVVDPHLVKLILHEDQIIGFVLGFRDLSAGLQRAGGRLWPFGWYHILAERQRTRWINLNGLGLAPEFRGVGADALLLTTLDETIRSAPFEHAYLVQVEEGNVAMVRQALRLGVHWCIRHRSYRKAL